MKFRIIPRTRGERILQRWLNSLPRGAVVFAYADPSTLRLRWESPLVAAKGEISLFVDDSADSVRPGTAKKVRDFFRSAKR